MINKYRSKLHSMRFPSQTMFYSYNNWKKCSLFTMLKTWIRVLIRQQCSCLKHSFLSHPLVKNLCLQMTEAPCLDLLLRIVFLITKGAGNDRKRKFSFLFQRPKSNRLHASYLDSFTSTNFWLTCNWFRENEFQNGTKPVWYSFSTTQNKFLGMYHIF